MIQPEEVRHLRNPENIQNCNQPSGLGTATNMDLKVKGTASKVDLKDDISHSFVVASIIAETTYQSLE